MIISHHVQFCVALRLQARTRTEQERRAALNCPDRSHEMNIVLLHSSDTYTVNVANVPHFKHCAMPHSV